MKNLTEIIEQISNEEFSMFEDKPGTHFFDHLLINYKEELKRLENVTFKNKTNLVYQTLTKEIQSIKEVKQKSK